MPEAGSATDTNGTSPKLILASGSPRRSELLEQLGVAFDVLAPRIDESIRTPESAHDYVRRLALSKAETICERYARTRPTLAADTAVVINGQIMGKPSHREHARYMMRLLSGQWHEVYSGVALVYRAADVIAVRTRVKFRSVTNEEINAYWASGEPRDKAGAYAIQGLGGAFVERIDGSYSNVVGLPLVETLNLLNKQGIAHRLATQF